MSADTMTDEDVADVDAPIPYRLADLPPGQARVLAWVKAYWLTEGQAPSIREVVAGLGFAGPNSAVSHLKPLADKGCIEWGRGRKARTIYLPGLRDRIRAAVAEVV